MKAWKVADKWNYFYDEHEDCNGAGFDCFELAYEFPAEESMAGVEKEDP